MQTKTRVSYKGDVTYWNLSCEELKDIIIENLEQDSPKLFLHDNDTGLVVNLNDGFYYEDVSEDEEDEEDDVDIDTMEFNNFLDMAYGSVYEYLNAESKLRIYDQYCQLLENNYNFVKRGHTPPIWYCEFDGIITASDQDLVCVIKNAYEAVF
jgi:hypothetical protein